MHSHIMWTEPDRRGIIVRQSFVEAKWSDEPSEFKKDSALFFPNFSPSQLLPLLLLWGERTSSGVRLRHRTLRGSLAGWWIGWMEPVTSLCWIRDTTKNGRNTACVALECWTHKKPWLNHFTKYCILSVTWANYSFRYSFSLSPKSEHQSSPVATLPSACTPAKLPLLSTVQ